MPKNVKPSQTITVRNVSAEIKLRISKQKTKREKAHKTININGRDSPRTTDYSKEYLLQM